MNKKIIEGLESIAQGINSIVEGLKQTECTCACDTAEEHNNVDKKSSKTTTASAEKKTAKVDDSESTASNSSTYTEEELSNMSYNDIKKLAKELGISAVGNRKEIVKKILSADVVEAEDEEDAVEAPAKSVKSKSFNKKTKVEEPESVEEDDEEDEDDNEGATTEDMVKEATADMSDDEIRSILEDVGVSSKGKRQALISKLVKAVDDGLIDLDGDEEEDEEEEKESNKSTDVTEGMTKARKKAYEQLVKDTEEDFENGDISREDLIEFINAFNGTSDKFKKVSDEDLLMQYLELSAMLVSDEGEIVEEGAYTINEEPYCCGHPLTYDEDEEKFVCECCGSEYEAE